jgi:hypothetical protein
MSGKENVLDVTPPSRKTLGSAMPAILPFVIDRRRISVRRKLRTVMPKSIRDITIVNDLEIFGQLVTHAALTGAGIREATTDWLVTHIPKGSHYLLTNEPSPGFISTVLNPLMPGRPPTNNHTQWEATAYGAALIPLSYILAIAPPNSQPSSSLSMWMLANAWRVRFQYDDGTGQPTPWSTWYPPVS